MRSTVAPDVSTGRIHSLDVLRGVAVLGILVMNVNGFAMPEQAYFNPRAYGGDTGANLGVWFIDFVLADGKLRGLFSLLFGASMLLVIERAEASGLDGGAVHYRRMLWLAVFGAAHFYLIWWGDILLHYAMIGLVAFLFRRATMATLITTIGLLLLLDLLLFGTAAWGMFEARSAALAAPGDTAAAATWRAMSAQFAPLWPGELNADLALHRGPLADLNAARWSKTAWLPFQFLLFGGPETLALMLAGMALYRCGFLTGGWAPERYRRIAIWGLAIGWPGSAIIGLWVVRSGFNPTILFAGAFPIALPFRLLLILAYAALLILLARRGGALVDRLAAAGRAAFSNYLGTSLAMTLLFYGHGLALYGQFSRVQLWLVVLGAWLAMLAWSKPWLDRYRYGPFEWLWRCLARGRLEPIGRQAR